MMTTAMATIVGISTTTFPHDFMVGLVIGFLESNMMMVVVW
jgi:hypothetical protein